MDKKCDDCGVNDAIVHLTHIMQNQTQVFHLCEECASKRGITLGQNSEGQEVAEVSLEELEEEVVCGKCLLKLSVFRSEGRLGCAECYKTFEAQVAKILRQVHGSTRHTGKRYGVFKSMESGHNLEQLRSDLDAAIKNEQFEAAAQLRDAIHLLKQEVK
ncbi:MAG: UvrB/UvrC motif-containing protein [Chitinispirillales bacterium]|nr:UvrB/UvrC motif-containing protein [Chitinispirillales bacterium]